MNLNESRGIKLSRTTGSLLVLFFCGYVFIVEVMVYGHGKEKTD